MSDSLYYSEVEIITIIKANFSGMILSLNWYD